MGKANTAGAILRLSWRQPGAMLGHLAVFAGLMLGHVDPS